MTFHSRNDMIHTYPKQILLFKPHKLASVEHRTFLADTQIAIDGLLNTTQAGTQTASHKIFKRGLTVYARTRSITCHGNHHRLGTAGRDA